MQKKSKPEEELTSFMIHDMPKMVKEKFKAACAFVGKSMRDVSIELFEKYTKDQFKK